MQHGIDVVRPAQIARVDDQKIVGIKSPSRPDLRVSRVHGRQFVLVGPVGNRDDLIFVNAPRKQIVFHSLADHDIAVRPSPDPIAQEPRGPAQKTCPRRKAEHGCCFGENILYPIHETGALDLGTQEGWNQGAWWVCQADKAIVRANMPQYADESEKVKTEEVEDPTQQRLVARSQGGQTVNRDAVDHVQSF